MVFFLLNFLASGSRMLYNSDIASWTIWEQVVPRRKRATLGFSDVFGSRLSSARFERALRGFLQRLESWHLSMCTAGGCSYICRNIVDLLVIEKMLCQLRRQA
jgi:hypothetical protein